MIYRGPDHALPPAGGSDQETPTWMGVSTQMPVRPRSNDPWEPRRGFSGTSRVVTTQASRMEVLNSLDHDRDGLDQAKGECDS